MTNHLVLLAGARWSRGRHRGPARCQWHNSSIGHVLLQFWASRVPYHSAMLPGLETKAVLDLWLWPRRVLVLDVAH